MKTESEKLFEQLCITKNIKFEPIPIKANLRTPDYRIWLNSMKIIVEVKQMEWNKGALHFMESVRKGEDMPSAFRGTGHLRIRNIIDNAYPQLKNFTNSEHPAIIVACDLTKGLSHLDYEDILNAMYGDEIVLIRDYSKDSEEIDPIRHRFGGNRKVTKGTKRFLSALAMLEISENTGNVKLVVFHNIHAKIPLSPQVAWQIADKQYTLQHDSDLYQYWNEIIRKE